jgi:hypothetical protein
MNWTKLPALATLMAALITSPATAYADCGDPNQPPCGGPVPTTDEVVAIMAKLTDPGIPAAKTIDDHLNQTNAKGLLPYTFVVSDIQPAPSNFAGATVTVTGSFKQQSADQPIVLADHGGHWLITHDTALPTLDHFWC